MAEIGQLVFNLTGWNGAPGANVFAISPNQAFPDWPQRFAQAASELRTVYAALAQNTPQGWTAVASGIGRVLDDASGELLGVGAYDVPDPVTSPVTATEGRNSRATQIVASYRTQDIHRGRLIRGRTYLGPVIPAAFANDGTILQSLRNDLEAAYGGLLTGLGPLLAVWSRPGRDATGQTYPGSYGDVTEVTVSAQPGVLRSRRD